MEKRFRDIVTARPGGENLNYCYSCGSCTATCPISELDNDYNPRLMIKKIQLGLKNEVLESPNIWKCIQCHRCVAHCPQNVKFADIVRVLRELAVEEGYFKKELITTIEEVDKALWERRLWALERHLDRGDDFLTLITDGGEDNE